MKFFTIKDMTVREDLISHIKINPAYARVDAGEIYLINDKVILVNETTARELQVALSKASELK